MVCYDKYLHEKLVAKLIIFLLRTNFDLNHLFRRFQQIRNYVKGCSLNSNGRKSQKSNLNPFTSFL